RPEGKREEKKRWFHKTASFPGTALPEVWTSIIGAASRDVNGAAGLFSKGFRFIHKKAVWALLRPNRWGLFSFLVLVKESLQAALLRYVLPHGLREGPQGLLL